LLGPNQRDADDHQATILKLQYQKNFSPNSYLRLFGYSEYNTWFINGPVSAFTSYGGEIQDYEVHGNDYGVTANYANQLNEKNLLTATGSYLTQKLETYSGDTIRARSRRISSTRSGKLLQPNARHVRELLRPDL
jgi:hypothetical protein